MPVAWSGTKTSFREIGWEKGIQVEAVGRQLRSLKNKLNQYLQRKMDVLVLESAHRNITSGED